ncbi:3-dehydroquinate synthase [Persicitalea jodogahamensis]|uniref:3-dehydroquinate synthase n=1 Tax=Persicitalea jodogahamensis TaxID=402147 RepID=A0A8J3G9R9_9BACT|nr:3-dehydroquinate synthase [Persicitalea jodogahamensis]GHB68795.1 3-dehydroquinate synthase [Persicitalea jodogahamensis]
MDNSVHINPIISSLESLLENKDYSKIIVIADTNTRKFCYNRFKSNLPKHSVVSVPVGEAHKTLATCEQIWEAMTRAELDRHALVINVGGGVIGDMGGFCAATYKRGIDFIQVPTTLLAQVDASVGGKLGIDFQGFKNHLGVFQLPIRVLIDPVFLETLPERELRSGFAEVVKHCLIADVEKWHEIRERDLERQNWPDLIAHSVAIKQAIVAQDPTEKGLRKILNFGHTLGHAVETLFLAKTPKERLMHGEAIAAGMVMESYLAYQKKMIDRQTLEQVEEFMFSVFGKTAIQTDEVETIISLTRQDKKNRGNEVRFSLLNAAGNCAYDVAVAPAEMRKALQYYIGL